MTDMQAKLDYAEAVADWFLEVGETYGRNGRLDESLKCTHLAAIILSRQSRILSSERVESNLRLVAERLEEGDNPKPVTFQRVGQKETCLHVLSEALPAGGLTAMAVRWMQNDREERIHSVVLLSQSQESPPPSQLSNIVFETGGKIYSASPADSLLERAIWLRHLANEFANYVILHVDLTDVICGAAFGKRGGSPVLLVNHAAHVFWAGATIVDLVVNCRGSALETEWTLTHRGVARCATVPIPLPERNPAASQKHSTPELKRQSKRNFGIPEDFIVFLTVGSYFKYLPVGDLDFVETFEDILTTTPNTCLVAVGFKADKRWNEASARAGAKIRVLGVLSQAQLAEVHDASDVYVEAFPFGTTTSLLEAGIKGIPVVLAPAQCPPPYGSDGIALDDTLDRPHTIEEYKTKVISLARNPDVRISEGNRIRRSIMKHHVGPGWTKHLENALQALPREHSTYPLATPIPTPDAIHEYWSIFADKWGVSNNEALEHGLRNSLKLGLPPRLTLAITRVSRKYSSIGINPTIPFPLLKLFFNFLVPIVPLPWARRMWPVFSFLFRPFLLPRVYRRLARLFTGTAAARPWYSEYRTIERP